LVMLIPPFLQFCLIVFAVGACMSVQFFSLTDELFGTTLGTVLVAFVRGFRSVCSHFAVLLAIPDLSPGDIRIVLRSVHYNEIDSDGTEHIDGSASPNRSGILPDFADDALEAAEQRDEVLPVEGDGFLAAAQWLKRPHLYIGLREQLGLYGLYMRARRPGRSSSGFPIQLGKWLEDAKSDARMAFARMPRPVARAQLVRRLAKADPLFSAAHPELGIPPEAGLEGIVLGLLERRLPLSSAQWLNAGHNWTMRVMSLFTLSSGLKVWHRTATKRGSRGNWRWGLFTLICLCITMYLRALAKGVHPRIHYLGAKFLAGLRGREFSTSIGGIEARGPHRLLQYLACFLMPRMNQSLFATQKAIASPTPSSAASDVSTFSPASSFPSEVDGEH